MNSTHSGSWWRYLKGYHWLVFILAACGWMFDTMDQQLFTASRADAMKELLPTVGEAARYSAGSWVHTYWPFLLNSRYWRLLSFKQKLISPHTAP